MTLLNGIVCRSVPASREEGGGREEQGRGISQADEAVPTGWINGDPR